MEQKAEQLEIVQLQQPNVFQDQNEKFLDPITYNGDSLTCRARDVVSADRTMSTADRSVLVDVSNNYCADVSQHKFEPKISHGTESSHQSRHSPTHSIQHSNLKPSKQKTLSRSNTWNSSSVIERKCLENQLGHSDQAYSVGIEGPWAQSLLEDTSKIREQHIEFTENSESYKVEFKDNFLPLKETVESQLLIKTPTVEHNQPQLVELASNGNRALSPASNTLDFVPEDIWNVVTEHPKALEGEEEESCSDSTSQLAPLQEAKINCPSAALFLQKCKLVCARQLLQEKSSTVAEYLQPQIGRLHTIIKQAIEKGESGSCLLLGRDEDNCQAVLNIALSKLEGGHQAFSKKRKQCSTGFQVVRVNGHIHSDDGKALRAIACQLGVEMEGLRDGFLFNMELVQRQLRHSRAEGYPSLIVIEAFEEFAKRSKQTLLYHLLDLTRQQDVHIFVVGITKMLGISSGILEKRVKSRFSGCEIFVSSAPKEHTYFLQHFEKLLTLKLEDFQGQEIFALKFNESLQLLFKNPETISLFEAAHIRTQHYSWFSQWIGVALRFMSVGADGLTLENLKKAALLISPKQHSFATHSLSVLEICVAICCKRLKDREQCAFSFPSVFSGMG